MVLVTEVKAKKEVITSAELLELEGYNLHLNPAYEDESTRGTAIYAKDYLNVTTLTNNLTLGFKDSTWVEIHGNSEKPLLLACIYRSGTHSKAVSLDPYLHNVIEQMSNSKNYSDVVIVGDFNHPKIKWITMDYDYDQHIVPKPTKSEHDLNFIKCLENSFLNQHVTKPTRIRENQTPTLDDLILSRNPETIEDLTHKSHLGKSDHLILQFEINYNIDKPLDVKKPRRNYMKTNINKFNAIINKDWNQILLYKSPEEAYNTFLQVYNMAVEEAVPITYTSVSTKYIKPPWMKPSTLSMVKKKHNLLTRYLNTRRDADKEAYHAIRNQVAHQTTSDRIRYEERVASETKNNVNAFWRYVNSNRKKKKSIPDLVKSDKSKATTDPEKAEVLNSQFSSVFTSEDLSTLPEFPDVNILQTLDTISVTQASISKKLKNLRSDKSPGPDGVHPHLLKTFADVFAPILDMIFTITLESEELPSLWKTGIITALYKKGKKSDAQNYRPVSLTSIPCKILESLIVDSIINHLAENLLKNPNQHGFSKGRSTVTNLISALNIWTEALSHNIPVDVIYLDFEKAFDKVPHQRLLNQLSTFGIRGKIHGWITSFLTNRTQAVRVNSAISTSAPVLSGVPQGSVLGPALFLIYVTNISDHIKNFTSLFADDTKLFSYLLETENTEHSTVTLQEDINTLSTWSEVMQMSFNLSKCHIMHLGQNNPHHQYFMHKSSHLQKKKNGLSYRLMFHDLEEVENETDLGVCIDHKLKFSDHISAKLAKANKMLQVIRYTFKHLTPDTFKKLYTSIVRPHLEYATPVWTPHTATDIIRIESLQRRATRLVPSLSEKPYAERLKELSLPTLEYRRIRQDLLLLWSITTKNICLDQKTYCYTCPGKMMLQPTLSHRTRGHSLKYQIQQHQSHRSHFFSSRVIPIWNKLQDKTVTAININTFKSHLATDPSMPNQYHFSKIIS